MKEADADTQFMLAPQGTALFTDAKINVAEDMRTYRIIASAGLICNYCCLFSLFTIFNKNNEKACVLIY